MIVDVKSRVEIWLEPPAGVVVINHDYQPWQPQKKRKIISSPNGCLVFEVLNCSTV